MQNYFQYFTEIEERFQQRRGTLLMLSTLDWALIDTWREAGVPLGAVLRGIDDAFEKRASRSPGVRRRARPINGLAWCAQSVMQEAERASEAALGVDQSGEDAGPAPEMTSGFEAERVAAYLRSNAARMEQSSVPGAASAVMEETSARLRQLADELAAGSSRGLEELDGALSALESRVVAALLTGTEEAALLELRQNIARELAAYRSKLPAVQARQVQQQMLEKRLLERHGLPRLSLFYIRHA